MQEAYKRRAFFSIFMKREISTKSVLHNHHMHTKGKFTPGPWRIITDAQGPCMVMHPTKEGFAIASSSATSEPSGGFYPDWQDETLILQTGKSWEQLRDERNANVLLIAAAPELLEALNLANEVMNEHFGITDNDDAGNSMHDKVRAAITAATKEQV